MNDELYRIIYSYDHNELSDFGILAHELYGHEHLGITEESLVPEIYSAADALIKSPDI